MIFWGLLALLLCMILLGFLWRHETALPPHVWLWGYFVKALFISWGWFLVSFYTPLGTHARLVCAVLIAAVGLSLIMRPIKPMIGPEETYKTSPSLLYLSAFYIVLIAAIASSAIGSIFVEWDAVVSWNRWGVELASNEYNPISGGSYPILWPAIWSLIYEAQESTSLWMITKASVVFPVVFSGVFFAGGILGKQPLSGLLLATIVFLALIFGNKWLLSGYMDMFLSLIGMISLLLFLKTSEYREDKQYHSYMILSVITVSMAMVTKQGGLFFGAPIGAFIIIEFLNKRISFKRGLFLAAIMLLPLCLYLGIYFQEEENLFGNFGALRNQSAVASKGLGGHEIALKNFKEILPSLLAPIVIFGALLNVFFIRTLRGVFGIVLILVSVVTFSIYSDCCVYNERNLYPTIAMLLVSMFIGYSNIEDSIKRERPELFKIKSYGLKIGLQKIKPLGYLFAPVLFLVGFSSEYKPKAAMKIQKELQISEMGFPRSNALLVSEIPDPESVDFVVTHYQLLKYVPEFETKFYFCQQTTAACITKVFQSENVNTIVILTHTWNESPVSNAFLRELKDKKIVSKVRAHPEESGMQLIWLQKENWITYNQSEL